MYRQQQLQEQQSHADHSKDSAGVPNGPHVPLHLPSVGLQVGFDGPRIPAGGRSGSDMTSYDSCSVGTAAARLQFSTEEIRKVFRAMDKKGHGGITAKELCLVMKKMGSPTSEAEARSIVQQADKRGTGMITENDFVSFMRERAGDFTRQLRAAFQAMDTDKSGVLTPKQLRSGFAKMGMTFSDQEFKDMVAVVDSDKSGEISWEEFLSAMH